ncbi:MAG: MFS transporter, partial [Acidimicrobiaceae bacterium]
MHSLIACGEAAFAIALADSLFLSISPDAARSRVLLFLAMSLAPFAIVAPFIGPVIDRIPGGRRITVFIVALLR